MNGSFHLGTLMVSTDRNRGDVHRWPKGPQIIIQRLELFLLLLLKVFRCRRLAIGDLPLISHSVDVRCVAFRSFLESIELRSLPSICLEFIDIYNHVKQIEADRLKRPDKGPLSVQQKKKKRKKIVQSKGGRAGDDGVWNTHRKDRASGWHKRRRLLLLLIVGQVKRKMTVATSSQG